MQTLTKQTLRIYWKQTWKYKSAVVLVVVCTVMSAATTIATPILVKAFFNQAAAASPGQAGALLRTVGYLAALAAAGEIFWRLLTYTVNFFQPRVMSDLIDFCYEYLLGHSYGFFADNFIGGIVTRARRFQSAYEKISDTIIWNFSRTLLQVLAILGVLFYIQPLWGFLLLGWGIVWISATYKFTQWKLRYDLQAADQDTKTTAHLADTLTNNINLKLFTGQAGEIRAFRGITEQLYRFRRRSWDIGAHFEVLQSAAVVLLEFALMYSAVKFWQRGRLSLGDFALLQLYLGQIFYSLWDLGKYLRNLYGALADANEMTEMLVAPHEVVDAPGADKLQIKQGSIEFRNVGFHYQPQTPILSSFNLKIQPGERVALIGPSGGGKSTIVKLLFRFKDVQSGAILVDGQDISAVSQNSLRSQIALVPQEPILFHRSLEDNIRYGRPDATHEEIVAAARAAHAHEFISKLPAGYATFVGERGIKLSGGERQRVAIARAILKNAPILVLDEATSSLDSESEALIQDALQTLIAGKTAIVIAHRLSTIMKMDRIIVIESGRVIEEGRHEELLKAQDGTYQRLWEIQAGGFATAAN